MMRTRFGDQLRLLIFDVLIAALTDEHTDYRLLSAVNPRMYSRSLHAESAL